MHNYKLCEKALNCCGKLNFKDLKVIRPGLSYVFINFSQQSFQSSFPIYWYCNTRSSYPFFFCTDNHNDNLYYRTHREKRNKIIKFFRAPYMNMDSYDYYNISYSLLRWRHIFLSRLRRGYRGILVESL